MNFSWYDVVKNDDVTILRSAQLEQILLHGRRYVVIGRVGYEKSLSQTHTHTHTHTDTHIYTHIHTHNTYTHARTYTHTYTHTHTHTQIHKLPHT